MKHKMDMMEKKKKKRKAAEAYHRKKGMIREIENNGGSWNSRERLGAWLKPRQKKVHLNAKLDIGR